jgi:hypothetical protein
MTTTTREMAGAIKDHYSSVPEMQVSAGIYIHGVGRKYVTLLNTWESTRLERVDIETFYNNYIGGR